MIRQLRPEFYGLVWVGRLRMMRILASQMTTRVFVDLDDVQSGFLAARLRCGLPHRGMVYEFLEYRKWRRSEMRLNKLPYTHLVCSEADKQLMGGGNPVKVMPNGIELPESEEAFGKETSQPLFLFL